MFNEELVHPVLLRHENITGQMLQLSPAAPPHPSLGIEGPRALRACSLLACFSEEQRECQACRVGTAALNLF